MSNESAAAQSSASASLAGVQSQLLSSAKTKGRARRLLAKHHYLGDVRAVGEQLFYAITDACGHWLGVLVFCAASRRLRARDQWIGWSEEQRRRRLPLIVNNCRFLLLPHKTFPNLGSRSLRLTLDRLSTDWQARYGHPVVLVETFVDPEQFCGTVYSANGWQELGKTDGFGRVRRDFYTQHNKPKRLFARELCRRGRRSLAADKLKPSLAAVEAKICPRSTQSPAQIRSLIEYLKSLPDYRQRIGIYPLWSLVAICVLAHLCGAPRGQKDLAKFANGLSQAQRRALGIRQQAERNYPAPSQPTFCRLMEHIDDDALERIFLQVQEQIRGPAPPDELIVLDGKQPRHGGGHSVLTAVTVPSQHYLGSAMVDQKTNEIPVARELFKKLDLDGRKVSLDALHTQDQTARDLVLEHGADFLLTVKDNQPTLRANIEKLVPAPPADFSPSLSHPDAGRQA
ncbi:MAG TPA: ISAs1 family transposase [Bradyrhizobium sp.]|nr:ISAs1 family transposase [Bradyrhizobium sp.]